MKLILHSFSFLIRKDINVWNKIVYRSKTICDFSNYLQSEAELASSIIIISIAHKFVIVHCQKFIDDFIPIE